MTATEAALEIRIDGGILAVVPNAPHRITPFVLLEQEDWFEDEIRFVRHLPWRGMRALDIGANYGLYALTLAATAGPEGRVWAIEPAAETAGYLRRSAARNGMAHLTVHALALSDREGSAELILGNSSELHRLEPAAGSPGSQEPRTGETVRLGTLDGFAAEEGCAGVDFIKLDVEGSELRVIEGGLDFLAAEDPLLQVEITDGRGFNLEPVRRLADLGYRAYRLLPGIGLLAPHTDAEELDPNQLNLFACKAARAERMDREGLLCRALPAAAPVPATAESAVALHALARDSSRTPAERCGALLGAWRAIAAACAERPTARRLGTSARIAADLGWRRIATQQVTRALDLLVGAGPAADAEPFLPASRYFDGIHPGRSPENWLRASLLDALATQSAYSSYYWTRDMAVMLDLLRDTGYLRPQMERRRQLSRLMLGLQKSPESNFLLAHYGRDNLNPELWGGAPPPSHARIRQSA